MNSKIVKLAGAVALALLLTCGLITGLTGADSSPSTSLPTTNQLIPIELAPPPANGAQQAADCSGFNDIVGATYDPDANELIVFGQITGTLPMMDYSYLRENLVVAMRAVHAAPEYPGVTIGTTPSPDPNYQLVEYFGNITDTHYGYVFFEADRLLKSYSLGKDNLNPTEPFTSGVPGYVSFFDRYLALEDTTSDPISQRFWFSPTLNLETVPGDPYGVVFSNTQVNLLWTYLSGSGTSAKATQAADDFMNHFNAHYHDFAAEQAAHGNQTFNELVQLFKLFGIAHWTITDTVQINVAGVSGPWLDNYPITSFTTPVTTPTASRTGQFSTGGITYTITISGGVSTEPPAYNPNSVAGTAVNEVRNSRLSGMYNYNLGPVSCICPTDISGAGVCPLNVVASVFPISSKNHVSNGSFEDGPASPPWVQYSAFPYELISTGAGRSGNYGLYLGDYANADDYIYQDVTLPATAVRPMLIYHWYMFSAEPLGFASSPVGQSSSELPPFIIPHPAEPWTSLSLPRRSAEAPGTTASSGGIIPAAAHDFMYVEILDTSDNLLETLQTVTNDDVRNQWQTEGLFLDAYKGQTIRIRFRATNDATNHTAFLVDDVSLDTASSVMPCCTYLPILLKNAR